MSDNPARTVALALAEDVCPGCICAERKPSCSKGKEPCPFFHPDNFYYDKKLKHFWCANWIDSKGNTEPY
jgi:hypothetical protein